MKSPCACDRRTPFTPTVLLLLVSLVPTLFTAPVFAQTATIALVQHAGKDAGTATSAALAFPVNNVAAHAIVVAIRAGIAGQVFTVTDTRGNAYHSAVRFSTTADPTTLAIFYAENIAGGANTVTVSDNLTGGTLRFAILEYSGVATTGSLDGTATGQGASSAPATAAAPVTASGDLAIGLFVTSNSATFGAGGGFVLEELVPAAPATKLAIADRVLASAGALAANATLAASDNWGAVAATFRAGTATGPDTQAPSAPGALTATPVDASRVDLRWSAATDNVGVTQYQVERCQGAGCVDFTPLATVTAGSPPVPAPLRVSANPNYFMDASGTPVVLNGSHAWNTLQDWGTDGTLQPIDFNAFVNFLVAHGHNFTYLWRAELPHFCGLPTTATSPPPFNVGPHPWMRTGPGTASDGGLKFDLSKPDTAYFGRLRARVQALNSRGIYAGVYLFTGEWLAAFRCAGDGYPFTAGNNVNGVDDGGGIGSMTMTGPNAISAYQDAYVEKVIDTLNDLPNVLWIVSEEAPANTGWWHAHQIAHIHTYEAAKPQRHPVGYAVMNNLDDTAIVNSNADWVCPAVALSPTSTCGAGTPACKVNINDSDHSEYGMWNQTAQANRNYAWNNFTNGNQVAFMDPYLVNYPRENRNLIASPVHGIGSVPDPRWDNFRDDLGAILRYSRKLNMAAVMPRAALSSTSHCLAQTPSVGAEYLVYAPNGGAFTVDLSAMSSARSLAVEWFAPATGVTTPAGTVPAGATARSFTPPFGGDAVLYLVDTGGHAGSTAGIPLSYRVTGQTSAAYCYRVRAGDAAGNLGPYSNIATKGTDLTPPATPEPFTAAYLAGAAHLHWGPNGEPDLSAYHLYRSTTAGFTPGPANLISATSDTGYVDASPAGSYYKLSALDAAGNESGFAMVFTGGTLGVGDGGPLAFSLEPVHPNPARTARMIVSFTLAVPAPARLELLDVVGRRVRVQEVGAMGVGRHTLDLADGRRLPPGLYLIRLMQGGVSRTTRVVVVD